MLDFNLTLTLLAVFASVALISGSLTFLSLERSSATRRRIRDLVRPGATKAAVRSDLGGADQTLDPRLKTLATFIPKSPKELGKLRRRLAVAGYHKASHAVIYGLCEIGAIIVGFALPLLVVGWRAGLMYGVIGAVVGYFVPVIALERLVRKRMKQIENGLPDALDLLIVCLEAGLALDQALLKSSEELAIAHPALAEELRLINVETRAGKPRLEAFKNFAARTKVDDVRALVAMLIQTDRFGTSVAQALRTHAEVSRTKRRQRAEERAAKIGVKMVFPLVFCLFPALYVVTLGPAVIKFAHAFETQGFGGVQ